MATAMEVANYLIQLRDVDESNGQYFSLTNLKLQKILYYCQGGHYKWDNQPLITDQQFEPWDYGPVIDQVYQVFKKFGQNDLTITDILKVSIENKDERETIKAVWNQLKHKDAFELVRSSHMEDPWKKNYRKNIEIPNSDIRAFFRGES